MLLQVVLLVVPSGPDVVPSVVLLPALESALSFVLVVCWRGGIDHGRRRFQEPRSQQSLRRGSGSYLQEKVPNDECGGTSRPVSQMQPLALVAIVEIKAGFVALLSGGRLRVSGSTLPWPSVSQSDSSDFALFGRRFRIVFGALEYGVAFGVGRTCRFHFERGLEFRIGVIHVHTQMSHCPESARSPESRLAVL